MEENYNNEEGLQIDFFEILSVLMRYSWLIILCGVCGLVAAAVFTITCIAPTYTSSLSFYVRNSEMQNNISSISANEINSSIQLAKTYTVILQNDSILEKIGTDLIEKFGEERVAQYYTIVDVGDGSDTKTVNAKQLSKQISIQPVDETEILEVTAVTEDPEFSAAICESLESIAPDELKRIVGIDYIEPIGRAKIPTSPSGPNVKKNGVLGFAFGVLCCGAVIVLLNLLDTKIYSGDFIREKYDIPVFGEIPYYEMKEINV
ncbi:MAG: Wzz/FepE/Etk N-terminal domain-containing protein [Clostridiales bacterium]|nr:Wzz/FepE/Etk N-terminal domain-containing protein [Clostridiales bacterium]